MYTDLKIQESIRKVEAARAENVKLSPARMSCLLYTSSAFRKYKR